MRIVNRDLTKESVIVYVTDHQVFAKIFSKTNGKWKHEEYFQSYDFSIDEELISSTIKYIKRTWGLENPKIIIK